jgi:hypothetical protein
MAETAKGKKFVRVHEYTPRPRVLSGSREDCWRCPASDVCIGRRSCAPIGSHHSPGYLTAVASPRGRAAGQSPEWSIIRSTRRPSSSSACSAAGRSRSTATVLGPKKSRSLVRRSTSPRTMSAAPPAKAKPSASASAAMARATRSCSGLRTQGRSRAWRPNHSDDAARTYGGRTIVEQARELVDVDVVADVVLGPSRSTCS